MKNRLFIITLLLEISLVLFNSCASEPEDEPKSLFGKYKAEDIYINHNGLSYDIDVTNTPNLIIESDYSFTLSINGNISTLDSVVVIEQKGLFEVHVNQYDKETARLDGMITFYPNNSKSWGSIFSYEEYGYPKKKWELWTQFEIVSNDGTVIYIRHWLRIDS